MIPLTDWLPSLLGTPFGTQAWATPWTPPGGWTTGLSLRARNTVLDRLFYNVGGLTPAEVDLLTRATTREGRILIVHPAGTRGDVGISLFDDHAAVRASPGALLDQFCVAGVGSSDLGAAALARDIANATRKPVGAIVAGYGMVDVVAEGLGGWAYLGAMNRLLALTDTARQATARDPDPDDTADTGEAPDDTFAAWATRDCAALRQFFHDEDRDIRLLVGHSKGCLSIADSMNRLTRTRDAGVYARMQRVRIVTTGAVVRFPALCTHVTQYLGDMDMLGAANSRGGLARVLVPNTGHHLNTHSPYHMSLTAVLRHAETGRALWVPRTH